MSNWLDLKSRQNSDIKKMSYLRGIKLYIYNIINEMSNGLGTTIIRLALGL